MAYLGSARAFRRMRRAAAVAIFLAGTVPTSAAARADPPLERAVKASFLLKFVPFVDWPANAFGSATAPFQICLNGQEPFGSVLDEVVRGQRVHGRTIIVRRLKDASPARSEEHTSELQTLMRISYDVFCWTKKKKLQK